MENTVAQACTQGEYPVKKDWGRAATNQGTTNRGNRGRTDPSPAPSGEAWPQTSGLQNHETISFCSSRPTGLLDLVTAALANEHR